MSAVLYRAVCEGRAPPREVIVEARGGMLYVEGDSYHPTTHPRAAVAHYAWPRGWPVVEIRGPGETTTAEAVAAEREACADLCDALHEEATDPQEDLSDVAAERIRARGTAPTP